MISSTSYSDLGMKSSIEKIKIKISPKEARHPHCPCMVESNSSSFFAVLKKTIAPFSSVQTVVISANRIRLTTNSTAVPISLSFSVMPL